ncbi:hypothetical protein HGB07_03590 [Candidatus Roizmanbacteria bacterium]|nr:hypothetical protein [Candidatus Roizmanbacteria bacterium]
MGKKDHTTLSEKTYESDILIKKEKYIRILKKRLENIEKSIQDKQQLQTLIQRYKNLRHHKNELAEIEHSYVSSKAYRMMKYINSIKDRIYHNDHLTPSIKNGAWGLYCLGDKQQSSIMIAKRLLMILRKRGIDARLITDLRKSDTYDISCRIIFSPARFIYQSLSLSKWFYESSTYTIVVEEDTLPTAEFTYNSDILAKASEVWTFDVTTSTHLQKNGIKAYYRPVTGTPHEVTENKTLVKKVYIPNEYLVHKEGSLYADKPIDVFFVGTLNNRRKQILSDLSPRLVKYRCFFYFIDDGNDKLADATLYTIARNSKLILNIHSISGEYLDWVNMVERGMMNRSLVITEPIGNQGIVEKDIDYIEAEEDEIADAIDYFLTPSGLREAEAIAASAYKKVTSIPLWVDQL